MLSQTISFMWFNYVAHNVMVMFQHFPAALLFAQTQWFTAEIFLNDWSEWTLSLTELAVKLLPLVTDGALVCWAVIHRVSRNKEKNDCERHKNITKTTITVTLLEPKNLFFQGLTISN